MRVRVRFRVNAETGEVERFVVEDLGARTDEDHDAVHDQIAYEVGKVVERRPSPEQVVGGDTGGDAGPLVYRPDEVLPATPERESTSE